MSQLPTKVSGSRLAPCEVQQLRKAGLLAMKVQHAGHRPTLKQIQAELNRRAKRRSKKNPKASEVGPASRQKATKPSPASAAKKKPTTKKARAKPAKPQAKPSQAQGKLSFRAKQEPAEPPEVIHGIRTVPADRYWMDTHRFVAQHVRTQVGGPDHGKVLGKAASWTVFLYWSGSWKATGTVRSRTEAIGSYKGSLQRGGWTDTGPQAFTLKEVEQAFTHRFQNPGRRAKAWLSERADAVRQLQEAATAGDASPESLAKAIAAFAKASREELAAVGRSSSWVVTGRSGRNAAKEKKRLETADAKTRRTWEIHKTWLKRLAAVQRPAPTSKDGLSELRERLASKERVQAQMKAANCIVRKKGLSAAERKEQLTALLGSASIAKEALKPDPMGNKGFPSYALSNNNSEIRRLKARLKDLEGAAEAPKANRKTHIGGMSVEVEDATEDYRIRLHFNDKPSAETRKQLKAQSWRWAPSQAAWQRQRTAAAWRSLSLLEAMQ